MNVHIKKPMWLKTAAVAGLGLCLSVPVWAAPSINNACTAAQLAAYDAMVQGTLSEGVRACLKGPLASDAVSNLNAATLLRLQRAYEKAHNAAVSKFSPNCENVTIFGPDAGDTTALGTQAATIACGGGDPETLIEDLIDASGS